MSPSELTCSGSRPGPPLRGAVRPPITQWGTQSPRQLPPAAGGGFHLLERVGQALEVLHRGPVSIFLCARLGACQQRFRARVSLRTPKASVMAVGRFLALS